MAGRTIVMTKNDANLNVRNENAMLSLGQDLSAHLWPGCVLFLHGDLGAGKTTLVRGVLQGLNYDGRVKSPTYTLVESYEVDKYQVYHFDLYRLADPEELEYMGIRDYFCEDAIALVEWPEKGAGGLPEADLDVTIDYTSEGRRVSISAKSQRGQGAVLALKHRE